MYSAETLTALIATVCSTFVHVNSGTSKRSVACPDGDVAMPSVRTGNALASCSCLLVLILCLLKRTFFLEQPNSSVLMETSKFQWLLDTLQTVGIKIWKQRFWMANYGHKWPKRTCIWSNNPVVRAYQTDKLIRPNSEGLKPVVRYRSKTGKAAYKGSKALKATEYLGCTWPHQLVVLSCQWLF